MSAALEAEDVDPVVDTAELLVSELVTNAVRHAATPSELMVAYFDETLRVHVADDDRSPPQLAQPDWSAEGGRGLLLVDVLADRWGWQPTPNGKRVWFEMSVEPART